MPEEASIIANLRANFAAIGDDAAVLPFNDKENYLVSKDILVEHRHFRRTTTSPADLAQKALHVNLSDIAAMGGVPLYVLLGIALPTTLPNEWVQEFLASFTKACKAADVQLIGGDTTGSDGKIFISVTVIGRAEKSNIKYRHGAKTGDVLCVAGPLGEAHAGLMALETKAEQLDVLKAKSTRPEALLEEGAWLGTQKSVTAMMDVSDGLSIDAGHLATESKLGAIIDLEALAPSAALLVGCTKLKLDPKECMLAGGEDYALLFTVAPDGFDGLAKEFEVQFGYPLAKIGTMVEGSGVTLREGGQPVSFTYKPFSHFGEL